jgi:hypothetical protein
MLSYLHGTDGYTVTQGEVTPFQGCPAYVTSFGTCFGNNVVTPYYVLNVPLGVGITLPGFMTGAPPFPGPGFGSTGPAPGYTPLNTFYQLKMNEAIIAIISMPPTAAYFSQETYMVERDAHWYDPTTVPMPTPPLTYCTPGTQFPTGSIPNRVFHVETPDCNYNVFGYINNAINNVLIQQQATFSFSNGPGCIGTSCAIAIIITPNQQIFKDAYDAFAALGYNTNLLFEEGMATGAGTPSPLLNVLPASGSLTYAPDTMATILRYTIPSGTNGTGTPSYNWEQNIGTNVLTFRLTQQTGGTITPIPTPMITSQSCNTNESGYSPPTGPTLCAAGASVQAHQAELRNILLNWFQTHVSASYTYGTASSPGPATGFGCLINGNSCAGPSPDNNGYRSFSPGALANGIPIVGVGILHSASPSDTTGTIPANNAVYTGLSISDDALNAGLTGENVGIADQTQTNLLATGFAQGSLTGSAAAILHDLGITLTDVGLIADLPNLYVVVFNQTSTGCVIPGSMGSGCTQSYIVNISSSMLPTTDPTKTTERGYLYPSASSTSPPSTAMQVGADPRYLGSPFILYVP